MSQAQKLNQGVYKQGDEVIVVLPSDKVVIIQQIPVVQVTTEPHQQSTLQKIQDKIHNLFESKPAPVQVVTISQKPVVQDSLLKLDDFNLTQSWNNFKDCWGNFDKNAAFHMTEFKRQYVLPIGDIPVRSVCMAVSTGLVYAVFGRMNRSVVARTRNLALSFLVNGAFWLPQSFNPFLFRQHRI